MCSHMISHNDHNLLPAMLKNTLTMVSASIAMPSSKGRPLCSALFSFRDLPC